MGRHAVYVAQPGPGPLKILHVVASYLPAVRYGGTIVSVHGLCQALAARGHQVDVFTTSVDGPRDSPVAHGEPVDLDGVRVWYFQSRHFRRLYYAPPLAAALRQQVPQTDVVHTHAIYLWPLWSAGAAARRAGVPYVVSPRGMLEKDLIERKTALWKSALIAFVERRHLEAAAAIHVTSRREREEAQRFGFNLPPIYEVPNGVDDPDAPPHGEPSAKVTALHSRAPFVLFLGRINWKKGLDRLITAMRSAPLVSLVIAGNDEEGYWHELQAQAAAQGVSDRVVYIGPVQAGDKAAVLRMARALVLPSYSENFGNVVLEAMAAGRPVIVTPEVGLADAIAESGAGWVVNGDPALLGRRIAEVAVDRDLCDRAGEHGRRLVRSRYSWSHVAEEMESVYERTIREYRSEHRT